MNIDFIIVDDMYHFGFINLYRGKSGQIVPGRTVFRSEGEAKDVPCASRKEYIGTVSLNVRVAE